MAITEKLRACNDTTWKGEDGVWRVPWAVFGGIRLLPVRVHDQKNTTKGQADLWFLSGTGVGVYVTFNNDNGMDDDLTHTAPRRYSCTVNWLLWFGRVHCRRDRPCQCGQRGHCAAFLSTSANFVDLYSYKSPITFRSPWPEQAPRRTVQRAARAPSRRGRRADLPLPMSLPPEPLDPTCTRTILPLAPISTRFRLAGAGAGCYCPVPYPWRRAAAERAAPHTTCAIKTKTTRLRATAHRALATHPR